MMKYLPLFLDLQSRRVLVVGNGLETERKVSQLLSAGAKVHVVVSEPLPEIESLAQQGRLSYRLGDFRVADLRGAWLVVSTGEDPALNRRVARAAARRRIFCNVVDVTSLCSFIYPAVVSRGDLHVAISTSGKSPALAQRVKTEVAANIGPEYGILNNLLGRIRPRVLESVPDREQRAGLFHKMVRTVLPLVKNGNRREAEVKMEALVTEGTGPNSAVKS